MQPACSGPPSTVSGVTSVSELDLDLDVFQGPFDLLLAVLLREEISLSEVPLGEIVIAYVDHMGETGDLDLEAVTEFLVLIAALCELKSRLLLPSEEGAEELGPQEAADELLARMLEYRRYSEAARMLCERLEREGGVLYRSAPLPPELRRAALDAATKVYEPERLGVALGDLLDDPAARPTRGTSARPSRSSAGWASSATCFALGKTLDFDEAFGARGPLHPGGHPVRAARALPPRRGDLDAEGDLRADRGARAMSADGLGTRRSRRCSSSRRSRSRPRSSPRRSRSEEEAVAEAIEELEARLERTAGAFGCAASPAGYTLAAVPRGGGRRPPAARQAADAAAHPGAGRGARDRRLPAAGLPARGRPHPRRLLGLRGLQPDRARD